MSKPDVKSERLINAITTLSDLLKGYAGIIPGHHLPEHLENLLQYARQQHYSFEVLFLDKPSDEKLAEVCSFFKLDEDARESLKHYLETNKPASGCTVTQFAASSTRQIRFYTSAHIPTRTTGQFTPVLKFIYWFQELAPAPHELEFIQYRLEAEGGLAFLFSEPHLLGLETNGYFILQRGNIASLSSADYEEWLKSQKLVEKLGVLKALSVTNSLEKISVAFSQFLEQEENDLRTRKFTAQQEVNNLKEQEKLNLRDAFQKIKADLQRDFSEFEKGIIERVGSLNRIQEGGLLAKTEHMISSLSSFEESGYADKVLLSLPSGLKDDLQSSIRTTCDNQIEQDIFSFKDFVEQTSQSVRESVATHMVDFAYTSKAYFNRLYLTQFLDETISFSKEYTVEKKKTQPMDYLRAATKPVMVMGSIYMLVRFIPFLKNILSDFTQSAYFILLIIGAVIYSFYSFLKNSKEAEAHFMAQEMKKMQDNLKAETRSMVKRFIDEWSRSLSNQIREDQSNFIQSLERSFSESAEDHKQKLAESQKTIQRRIQGLEQRERAHMNTIKNREQYDKAMLQLKGEISQVFVQYSYEA